MATYREDQGRLARMAAFWACVLLLLFGCSFLFDSLQRFDALGKTIYWRVPIVGIDLSPAFLIAATLFGGGSIALKRWQNTSKVADLLIDTEAELKKVSWPTMDEVITTSTIVGVFVVFIGGYLALTDAVFGRLAEVFIY